MKFLASFSLNSASFLLLVSEQKEWVLVHPYLTSGSSCCGVLGFSSKVDLVCFC